jgi:teichuronic acid biosynthesis glycosyltransferase TuaH
MLTREQTWLIWIAGVSWDGIVGTDRHMVTAMASHARILWVDPPISPMTAAPRRSGKSRTFKPVISMANEEIVRLTPVALPGFTRPTVRTTTPLLVRKQVRWAMRQLNIRPFAVVATYLGNLLGYWGHDVISVLYGTDDYVAGAELMGLSARYQSKMELRALSRAGIVVTVSQELARRWTRLGASPVVIPNGCWPINVTAHPVQAAVLDMQRPVVGLVGQLSERIDMAVLEAVAAAGLSLLLVGPVDPRWEKDRFRELTGKPNVRYTGEVPAAAVPSYLGAIDVGITPYSDSPFNQASFPLKTLEYLGSGLPVVSADLPAARWLRAELAQEETADTVDRVFGLARNDAEYVEAIRRMLARQDHLEQGDVGTEMAGSDQAISNICMRFAARHTWACRAETLASTIGLNQPNVPDQTALKG